MKTPQMNQTSSTRTAIISVIITGVFGLLAVILEKDKLWDILFPTSGENGQNTIDSLSWKEGSSGIIQKTDHTGSNPVVSIFIGTWYNQNPSTNNVTKVTFRKDGGKLKVAMEKKHQPINMGEHVAILKEGKAQLDFTMYNTSKPIHFKPNFYVSNGKLTMNMTQQTSGNGLPVSYTEYFAQTQPVPVSSPSAPAADIKPVQFAGTWKNLNLQHGIEQVAIRQVGNTDQFNISMVKVHPVKDMGTHTATLSGGKISLNFIHHGYNYIPTFTLSNGILIMSMVQKHADGTDYATYEERFKRE